MADVLVDPHRHEELALRQSDNRLEGTQQPEVLLTVRLGHGHTLPCGMATPGQVGKTASRCRSPPVSS